MSLNLPLFALATGAFGIGTTEFAPMGLLPVIAADLHVSIPTAGLLVTGYALGVVVGAPLLTLPTERVPRKWLLLGLMALFTLGNLLSALSPSYAVLLAARVVTSLCHGAFFGVGSVVAESLVAPDQHASAVAGMFMGLTIANIGGVPLATWVGQHLGWRAAFAGIAGLGVIAILAMQLALPKLAAGPPPKTRQGLGGMQRPAGVPAPSTSPLGGGGVVTGVPHTPPPLPSRAPVS